MFEKSALKITAGFYLIIFFVFLFTGCETNKNFSHTNYSEKLLKEVKETDSTSEVYLLLLDSLNIISQKEKNNEGYTASLLLKGKYLQRKGDNENAIKIYEEALAFSKQTKNYFALGEAEYNIGDIYFNQKKRDLALLKIRQSLDFRIKANDSVGIGSSLNYIGFMYWRISAYDSAVFYFEKALKIRNKLPSLTHRATTYNNLGTVFYNWSLYDKALDHYLHSLELQKKIEKNSSGIARVLCNIGLVYTETAQNEKALEYYRESLPYAIDSKLTQTLGYAYNCMGTVFSTSNKDSSLFYLVKSWETYSAGDDSAGMTLSLQGLGNFYLEAKDLTTSKSYFQKMLQVALSENIPIRTARAYKSLGNIFLLENNLTDAKKYLEISIEISKKSDLNFILVESYEFLSQVFEKMGDIKSAFSALKEHIKYKQLVENEGMKKRLLDLKNKSEYEKYRRNLQIQRYENEKQKIYLLITAVAIFLLLVIAYILLRLGNKRKRIHLLLTEKNNLIELHNREISQKNIELTEQNQAKEKLFSIIAHDLRSPFNTLINFATILREDYDELSDEERLKYISVFEETSINTYRLVENLLNLSAAQTGRISFNPSNCNVNEIISKIFTLLMGQASKKGISLVNAVDSDTIVFADSSMIEITIRNLVSNAIKYCNNGGEVRVISKTENNKVFISVHDDGVGMDDVTKENIFKINVIQSKDGTSGERGTGLGLGLCKEFVERNGGNLFVESTLGKGSIFTFSVAKANSSLGS